MTIDSKTVDFGVSDSLFRTFEFGINTVNQPTSLQMQCYGEVLVKELVVQEA